VELTKSTISDLSLPAGKTDAIFFDDDLPGFGIRLRVGGTRAWIVQYRVDGVQRRQSLGDARKADLNTARAAAKKKFAEVVLGGDPAADKAAAKARAAVTLGPLADQYLALKKPKVRKNTYVADKRYLSTYWKPLRASSIEAITRRTIAARNCRRTWRHGRSPGPPVPQRFLHLADPGRVC
jgi:hypothetical protein